MRYRQTIESQLEQIKDFGSSEENRRAVELACVLGRIDGEAGSPQCCYEPEREWLFGMRRGYLAAYQRAASRWQ